MAARRKDIKVRVGAQWYTIQYPKTLDSLGEFDMDAGVIRVRGSLDRLNTATTTLHEIIHAIADTLGGRMDEEQVRCLEQGLGILIQDNPEFVKNLVDEIALGASS